MRLGKFSGHVYTEDEAKIWKSVAFVFPMKMLLMKNGVRNIIWKT